mmetsp:Transcript_18692/g.32455  ORF Transcript_18692/g.32455 Transcript_18692/m.32455 type:complete len:86 (-) Transcript_18692:102-359(-)
MANECSNSQTSLSSLTRDCERDLLALETGNTARSFTDSFELDSPLTSHPPLSILIYEYYRKLVASPQKSDLCLFIGHTENLDDPI